MSDEDPPATAREIAAAAADDPIGWFDRLYVAAREGTVVVPWDRGAPQALVVAWATARGLRGEGRRALVVGCGLGDDAAFAAELGFATVAFDVSPTAVDGARARYPDLGIDFRVADLLDVPAAWRGAFDLVIESLTVQSLPDSVRPQAIAAVSSTVAPGGTLVVQASARDDDEPVDGPPWPLTQAEVESFATGDLRLVDLQRHVQSTPPPGRRWLAELRRDGA